MELIPTLTFNNHISKQLITFYIEQDFRDAVMRYRESLKEVNRTAIILLKKSLETSRNQPWVQIMY
jgi:hypothetical protein